MDGSTDNLAGVLRNLLDKLAPFSEQYGSGELYADLMVVIFVASVILLVMLLFFFPRSSKGDFTADDNGRSPDLSGLMADIRAEVKRSLSGNRVETEYIKHELVLIREQIADLVESMNASGREAYQQKREFNPVRMESTRKVHFNK